MGQGTNMNYTLIEQSSNTQKSLSHKWRLILNNMSHYSQRKDKQT